MKLVSYRNQPINDGRNYRSSLTAMGQVPAEVRPEMVPRTQASPVLGTMTMPERYLVINTQLIAQGDLSKRQLQQQWYHWFRHGVRGRLVISDDDGSNERYVWAAAFACVHAADGDGRVLETMLVLDGDGDRDLAWRSVVQTELPAWNITSSGDTLTVVNGVDSVNLDAYPQIVLSVNQTAGGDSNDNRLFVLGLWRSTLAAQNYPCNITNGALDTRIASTDFFDAGGDDIRVYVNGVDSDYWLHGINTAATSIWINLDWAPAQSASLSGDLDTGSLTTIVAAASIAAFPAAGLLLIDNEVFVYTGKAGNSFTGVARAQRNTAAATHTTGATIQWVQHDILIEYGNEATPAKVTDDDYKPIFNLAASTNTTWVYAYFFEDGAQRSGAWVWENLKGSVKYGGNQGAAANPYDELGCEMVSRRNQPYGQNAYSHWYLFNPCGIVGAAFSNGHTYIKHGLTKWASVIRTSPGGGTWTTRYNIPWVNNNAWYTWSYTGSGWPAGTRYLSMYHFDFAHIQAGDPWGNLECSDVTVTLNSNVTPLFTLGAVEASSRVLALLTNETTGEAIQVSYTTNLDTNDTLIIDVDRYTVTLARDGSNQLALVRADTLRPYLLRLAPGSNTLRYDDPNLVDVDVKIFFERRWLV
jgi:hypothetical protein